METETAIHGSPSAAPSLTTNSSHTQPLHGMYRGAPTAPISPLNAHFVPPPPPPPLGARSNTHSRQTSCVEHIPSHYPVNNASHAYMSHARTPSPSSWVPPPPPPPLAIPQSDGASYHQPTESSALELTLSPFGQSPAQLRNEYTNVYPLVNPPPHSSSHIRSPSAPSSTNDPNIPSPNTLVNYVPAAPVVAAASQYMPSHSHTNSYPFQFPTSQVNIQTHQTPAHLLRSLHFPPHHHTYTYPSPLQGPPHHPPSSTASTPTTMLTRTSTPFERGPFPSSSVPPHLQHRPSHIRLHHQAPPPPPRPPKPPELEVDESTAAAPLPTVPQRIHQGQQLLSLSLPSIHRKAHTAPTAAAARVQTPVVQEDAGAEQSPELHALSPPLIIKAAEIVNNNTTRQKREDVDASIADTVDKVSGPLPAGQACWNNDQTNGVHGHPRHLGGVVDETIITTAAEASTSQTELADETLAECGATTGIQGIGHARHAPTPDDAGDDGVRGTNGGTTTAEDREVVDNLSDSGMTIDNYDPTVFDFPRRVNDTMVHVVLSPVAQNNPPSTTTTEVVQATEADTEGEAPPTYDQVELESQLTHATTPTRVESANTNTIHSPLALYPAPTFAPPARQTMSPPPAFRPQTPPRPTTTTTAVGGPSRVLLNSPPTPTQHPNLFFHPPDKPTRPPPPPPTVQQGPTRAHSTSGSSSGHGHDGLMMTSRTNASQAPSRPIPPQPAIFTSPPTPSPSHSPRGSPTYLRSLRLPLPRRKNTLTAEAETPPSRSPTSESSDPFQDPPSFQVDSSPFAASFHTNTKNEHTMNDSPQSVPIDIRSHSPISEYTTGGEATGPNAWKARSRSQSGFWSNVSSTPPTPKSEVSAHELGRRHPEEATSAGGEKAKRRLTKGSGSRMSAFFRPGSSHGNIHALEASSRNSHTSASRSTRAGGVDLLDDSRLAGGWEDAHGQGVSPGGDGGEGSGDASHAHTEGSSPGDELEQSMLTDLWDGIEYGFCAPGWNTPPAPGPYSNPAEWPEGITLYPVGSKPFFVRAPTWRSLLRFLASQSTLRIEPSVEALATSRTPTMDLRLVVQFSRTPYTARGTTRDVCLYMMLHEEMPPATTRVGRAMKWADREARVAWDTRALPYGFICAEGGMLARHGPTAAKPNLSEGATELKGTPIADQDPDGENSMFVTIPPPFIELPVKMSDIALYLHECLVLSRKNGKTSSSHPSPAHLKRKQNGSNIHLPSGQQPELPEFKLSTPASTGRDSLDPASIHQPSLTDVPGLKRLAKAVKTFYPEEYAIGSSKANQAAEHAAVEEDLNKGKIMSVSNSGKGKGTSSGKSSGFLSAFQRVRSKSAAAKHTVSAAGGLGRGRDTNAERFELVTPWRE